MILSPAEKLLRMKNEFLGDNTPILIDSGAVVSLWPHKSSKPTSALEFMKQGRAAMW